MTYLEIMNPFSAIYSLVGAFILLGLAGWFYMHSLDLLNDSTPLSEDEEYERGLENDSRF